MDITTVYFSGQTYMYINNQLIRVNIAGILWANFENKELHHQVTQTLVPTLCTNIPVRRYNSSFFETKNWAINHPIDILSQLYLCRDFFLKTVPHSVFFTGNLVQPGTRARLLRILEVTITTPCSEITSQATIYSETIA